MGRGLAGALVAWKFAARGCDVQWWGNGAASASRVAAGMFNPVSFRRVVEVWNAAEHLAEMRSTVKGIESALGLEGQLLHDVPVAKVFANGDYRDTWDSRWEENHAVCQWARVGEDLSDAGLPRIESAAGVGKVHASGWVDVPKMLDALERHFESLGCLHDRAWNVQDGFPEGADALVDCRGVGASEDLAQVGVTVNPNHGDVLTLSTPERGPGSLDTAGCTINNGKWLLPTQSKEGRQQWRLGATYSWHRFTPAPDPKAASELRMHMAKAFDEEGRKALLGGQLEAHQAGLRPASPDRRPFVGPWPGQGPGWMLLNGLGTRGVLVGPAAAQSLVSWWLDGTELPEEMLPTRFKSVRESGPGFQE